MTFQQKPLFHCSNFVCMLCTLFSFCSSCFVLYCKAKKLPSPQNGFLFFFLGQKTRRLVGPSKFTDCRGVECYPHSTSIPEHSKKERDNPNDEDAQFWTIKIADFNHRPITRMQTFVRVMGRPLGASLCLSNGKHLK